MSTTRKLVGARKPNTGFPGPSSKIQSGKAYLYLTVDVQSDSNAKLFDEYGYALSCPICSTSLASAATMKLLYSSCCGRAVCGSCAINIRGACSTPGCNGQLTAQTWSENPIDQQRFKTEVLCRKRLNNLFGLKREFFDSKAVYDDYLEECQDIIYDLTHGNETVKRAAEEKADDLRRKYAPLLSRARGQAQREIISTETLDFPTPTFITSQSVIDKPDITLTRILPQVLSKPSSYGTARLDENIAKKASGLLDVREYRDILEVFEGIFVW